MSLVFLDIDGVLVHMIQDWNVFQPCCDPVTGQWRRLFKGDWYNGSPDPSCMALLNEIVRKSGCEVVLSSTWRLDRELGATSRYLQHFGAEFALLSATGGGHVGHRGSQIKEWLEENGRSDDNFAIIDDSVDMGAVSDHLVHVHYGGSTGGLQHKHIAPALKLLGE